MEDKRDLLYNNLINSGKVTPNQIGTIDQFKSAIKDEKSARQFHKNLLGAGFSQEEIGSDNDFFGSISSDFASVENQSKMPDTFNVGNTSFSREELLKPVDTSPAPVDAVNTEAIIKPKTPAATKVDPGKVYKNMEEKTLDSSFKPLPTTSYDNIRENYFSRFSLTEEGKQSQAELADMSKDLAEVLSVKMKSSPAYNDIMNSTAAPGDKDTALQTLWEKEYQPILDQQMMPFVNEYAQKVLSRYGEQMNVDVSKLDKANARNSWESIDSRIAEYESELDKRKGGWQNFGNATFESNVSRIQREADSKDFNEKQRQVNAAKSLMESSQKMINAADAEATSGFIGGVARGFKDEAFNLDNWTMGLKGLADGQESLRVLEKVDKGGTLTKEEKLLMDAMVSNAATQAYFHSDLGRGYKAGSVTGASLPFMVDMLTGVATVSAGTKAASKGLMKWIAKNYSKNAIQKNIAKGVTGLSKGVVDSAIHTASFGMGRVASDYTQREIGNMNFEAGDTPQYAGREGAESGFGTMGKAFASTGLETQSEMIGNQFAPALKLVGKQIMKLPGLKEIPVSDIGNYMKEMYNSASFKSVRQFAKDVQFHGPIAEYTEEFYNNLGSVAIGDMTPEQLVDLDQNIDTFLGVSIMSSVFGTIGAGAFIREKYLMSKFEKRIREYIPNLDKVKAKLTKWDIKGARAFIKQVMADNSLSSDEKKEEIKYIANVLKESAMNSAEAEIGKESLSPEDIEENKAAIYSEFEIARKNMERTLTPELVNKIDAGEDINAILFSNGLSEEQRDAIVDYQAARNDFEDYLSSVRTKIDEGKEIARKEVEGVSNPDMGAVVRVQSNLSEEPLHIVRGKIAFDEEGFVDEKNSDEILAYINNQTGKREQIHPSAIVSLVDMNDTESVAQQAEMDAEEQIINDEQAQLPEEQPIPAVGDEVITQKGIKGVITRFTPEGGVIVSDGEKDYNVPLNDILLNNQLENGSLSLDEESNVSGLTQNIDNTSIEVIDEQMPPTEVVSEEQVIDTPLIPVNEKGEPIYHKAKVEDTLSDIMDGSLDDNEVNEFISANRKDATDNLAKLQKKSPKMGTNKTKYLQDKEVWKGKIAEEEQRIAYWNTIEKEIKTLREKPGDTVAEDILSMSEPLNGEEFAAQQLANGNIRLLQSSFVDETGFGKSEAKKFFGLFASTDNAGMTIQEAGEALMQADRENGTNFFDQNDPNAGRDAIINVLAQATTRGDFANYIKSNREAMAERERAAEYEAYEQWCQDNFHMTPEEYESYQKQLSSFVEETASIISDEELKTIFAEHYLKQDYDRNRESNEVGTRIPEREERAGSDEGSNSLQPEIRLPDTEGDGRSEGQNQSNEVGEQSSSVLSETIADEGRTEIARPSINAGEDVLDYANRVAQTYEIEKASEQVDLSPTNAQKEAGNYKKGHIKIDGYDITIENPKGSERSGVDANGQPWSITMNNTYGYIRGTEGVDGDHIDVFLSDNPSQGNVFVVDQINENGSFDEHKVLYGFASAEAAREAYLKNYSPGWQGLGNITEVTKDEFKKWINSSHRKTKPFNEYKSVNQVDAQDDTIRFREVKDDEIISFAKKHNLDESDVREYAQSMKMNNLGGAAYAFKSIKRSVRLSNTGLSLAEFVKVFSPIKLELYEICGDVDALRDEYVQREMEKRNVMEAARKRAEEEAEIERKRLQEFELMTDEEMDATYFKAMEENDESRMRDIINESARRNGYVSADEFRMAHRAPSYDEEGYDKSMVDVAANKDRIRESLDEQLRMNRDKYKDESATTINAVLSAIDEGEKPTVTIYRAVPKSLKEGKVRNGDWVSLSESYVKVHGEHSLNDNYRIMKEEVPAENLYWDGNDINEWGYDDRSNYRYKNTKNNRKLNNLIIHDDKGNIIPPSKRFNARKADVRYRFIGEEGASNLEKAEESTTKLDISASINRPKTDTYQRALDAQQDFEANYNSAPITVIRSVEDAYEQALAVGMEEEYSQKIENIAREGTCAAIYSSLYERIFIFANVESDILSSLFHENCHWAIDMLFEEQPEQLDKLYDEFAAIRPRATQIIREAYKKHKENIGEDKLRNEVVVNLIENGFSFDKMPDVRKGLSEETTRIFDEILNYIGYDEKNETNRRAERSSVNSANELVSSREANVRNSERDIEGIKGNEPTRLGQSRQSTDREGGNRNNEGLGAYANEVWNTGYDGIRTGNEYQEESEGIEEAVNKLSSSLRTPARIIRDVNEITDNNSKIEQRKRKAKGWFDPIVGEVVLVLPNASSVEDAQETIFHETVAHYGLRKMFGKDFDTFLDNVYANAIDDIRANIEARGGDIRIATEEYLAELAERGFNNEQEHSFWKKIKDAFIDMLRKAGVKLGFKLTDNELRYVLWRSHENLRQENVLATAKDIAMQYEMQVGNYRYRKESEKKPDGSRELYESSLSGWRYKAQEAYQDSMLALKKLQETIVQISGKPIQSFEDAYIAENQLSSKNTAEAEKYYNEFFEPLEKEISKLMKAGASYDEISDYMILKHGIERNIEFSVRDIIHEIEKKDGPESANSITLEYETEKSTLYNDYAKGEINSYNFLNEFEKLGIKYAGTIRDYSATRTLLGKLTGKELPEGLNEKDRTTAYIKFFEEQYGKNANSQAIANNVIDEFESRFEMSPLWDKVNAATKQPLKKAYESGLMNKASYNRTKDMFCFYVPLRGWNEKTADDVYEYLSAERSPVNSVFVAAKGRKSIPDTPIPVIGNMAESTILQGNRNLMKQSFMSMIMNHPTDVATIKQAWYVKDLATNEWAVSFPNIEEKDSAEDIERKIQEHEERMRELEKENKATQKTQGLNINYKIGNAQAKEHIVSVKRNGKEYLIFINGNPRAAQAINGMTNPDVEKNPIMNAFGAANRWLAANFTTRNPAFVMSNLFRDLIFARSAVLVKESPEYALQFLVNVPKAMEAIMRNLKGNGKTNRDIDKYFKEFIENGGETGYMNLTDVDRYKKKIKKDLERLNGEEGNAKRALRWSVDRLDDFNRWAEDVSRFTTYMTSRQMERTIIESISDAKEITVNFNKKGAGLKTGGLFGISAGIIRNLYLFFNAGVQSLANFNKLAKGNPVKFGTMLGRVTAAGFIVPALVNQFLIGISGDGDDDPYQDLPEWVRRNNLCLYCGGGKFVTIPLPIELRAFYGLGDMIYQYTTTTGKIRPTEMAYDIANQFTELLPLNPLGNNGDLVSTLMPDVLKPFWQINQNKDFTGKPITKKTAFNELDPEFKRVYKGTSGWLVDASQFLNEISGGSDFRKGEVDINPAKIEHLFEAYFGGMGKTLNQLGKSIWYGGKSLATGEKNENLQLRNIPVANRFVNEVDERSAYAGVNKEYYRLVDEFEILEHEYNGLSKKASLMIPKYLNEFIELSKSQRIARHKKFELIKSNIDRMYKMAKVIPDDEVRQKLEADILKMKRQAIAIMKESGKTATDNQ